MLIAFEGPDNTGKSTSAVNLSWAAGSIYNANTDNYRDAKKDLESEPAAIIAFDRIDWFSHMVYRLSLPAHEWNDARPRTVFAMPDTHLVVKLHHPDLAELIEDELYDTGTLAEVNPMYYYFADFFMGLNEERNYALFKTVSIMEVHNDPRDKSFSQSLVAYSSQFIKHEDALSRGVNSDESLLALLKDDEQHRA